jgi:hypothetical protein
VSEGIRGGINGLGVNSVEIGGTQQKSGVQIIRGGKKVASIGAEQGDKGGESGGSVQVYTASEKPAATLLSGKNGGELNVYDTKNKPAATVGTEKTGGSLKIFGSSGDPVASIQSDKDEGKLSITDKTGKSVVDISSDDNGGSVKVMKGGDPTTYTSISAIDKGVGLAVRVAGEKKAFVGTNDEKNGAVFVYSTGDSPLAGLSTTGGRGIVEAISNGIPIAFLTESDKHAGGGNFTATNPAGEGIFSAGFTGEGGDACINRKNGLKCLGIGLPLQIN